MVQTKVENSTLQLSSAANIRKIWGDLIYNVKVYRAIGNGVIDDTTALVSAVSDASVSGGTVVFPPGTYKTGSFTVPSNVTLWFMNGAKLSINNGATVTINGPIEAGHHQIFSGLGNASGNPKIDTVSPCWFGAKDDGTDCSPAINKAITFLPAVGGVVQFPVGGWWKVASTITISKSNISIVGVGMYGATTIKVDSQNFIVFNITVDEVIMSDLRILGDANTTSGYAIRTIANHTTLKNIKIDSTYHGIYTSAGTPIIDNVHIRNIKPTFGIGLSVEQTTSEIGMFSRLVMENVDGSEPATGVSIKDSSGIQFAQCEFMQMGIGVKFVPDGIVGNVFSTTFTDCYFDNCRDQGVLMAPTGSGAISRTRFVNCWFGSNGTAGSGAGLEIRSGNVKGVTLSACDIYDNKGDGLRILTGANLDNLILTGSSVAGNTGSGISIGAAVSNFNITNNKIGPSGNFGANAYGIYINAGASDNYMITGNSIRGNTSGQLVDGGTGTNKVVSNNLTA